MMLMLMISGGTVSDVPNYADNWISPAHWHHRLPRQKVFNHHINNHFNHHIPQKTTAPSITSWRYKPNFQHHLICYPKLFWIELQETSRHRANVSEHMPFFQVPAGQIWEKQGCCGCLQLANGSLKASIQVWWQIASFLSKIWINFYYHLLLQKCQWSKRSFQLHSRSTATQWWQWERSGLVQVLQGLVQVLTRLVQAWTWTSLKAFELI